MKGSDRKKKLSVTFSEPGSAHNAELPTERNPGEDKKSFDFRKVLASQDGTTDF